MTNGLVELVRYILAEKMKWGRCYVEDHPTYNLETVHVDTVPDGNLVIFRDWHGNIRIGTKEGGLFYNDYVWRRSGSVEVVDTGIKRRK